MNIHLVGTSNRFTKLENNVWESGGWLLSEERALQLVGGNIYFHKNRKEPSFYGGVIIGFRVHETAESPGTIVFKLEYCQSCRNVSTDNTGWNKSVKITDVEPQEPAIPLPSHPPSRPQKGGTAKKSTPSGKGR